MSWKETHFEYNVIHMKQATNRWPECSLHQLQPILAVPVYPNLIVHILPHLPLYNRIVLRSSSLSFGDVCFSFTLLIFDVFQRRFAPLAASVLLIAPYNPPKLNAWSPQSNPTSPISKRSARQHEGCISYLGRASYSCRTWTSFRNLQCPAGGILHVFWYSYSIHTGTHSPTIKQRPSPYQHGECGTCTTVIDFHRYHWQCGSERKDIPTQSIFCGPNISHGRGRDNFGSLLRVSRSVRSLQLTIFHSRLPLICWVIR